MIPQFFVFVEEDTSPKHLMLIKGLMDLGYYPFVDAKNGDNKAWFEQNLKECEHRLYFVESDSVLSSIWESDLKRPDLLVAFSEGTVFKTFPWNMMTEIIKKICFTNQEKIDEALVQKGLEIFEKPNMIKPKPVEEEKVELPKEYSFRQANVGTTAFFEIIKPNVVEPYVTMVEDYQNYPMDLYTNWFKCQSFGVSNGDVVFLKKIWEYRGEAGELDLDTEYEKRVQRVLDGGAEPKVWRNTLENVIEIYNNAQQLVDLKGKRKAVSFDIQNKK